MVEVDWVQARSSPSAGGQDEGGDQRPAPPRRAFLRQLGTWLPSRFPDFLLASLPPPVPTAICLAGSSVLEVTANSKTFPYQCRLTILAWGVLLLTCVCPGLSCSPRTYTPT